MSAKLTQSLIYGRESDPFFDPNFNQILDSHIEYLKVTGSISEKPIDQKYIGQYYGDFYSALQDLGISPKYHRVVMLMNGLTSPSQYRGQFMLVLCPDEGEINAILGAYNTGKRKLKLDIQGN